MTSNTRNSHSAVFPTIIQYCGWPRYNRTGEFAPYCLICNSLYQMLVFIRRVYFPYMQFKSLDNSYSSE